jgi:hypothetical protein
METTTTEASMNTITATETRAARLARLGITGTVAQNPIANMPGGQTLLDLRIEKMFAAAE